MSHATFLADPLAVAKRGETWVLLYLKNPAGVETVLRFSRRGTPSGAAAVTVGSTVLPAHTAYKKRLLAPPAVSCSLWQSGRMLSSSVPSAGSLKLGNEDGGLDQYRPKTGWKWAGMRVQIFFFDLADIAGTIACTFDGRLGSPTFDIEQPVEVPLRGREADFEEETSRRQLRGSIWQLELSGVRVATFGTAPAALTLRGSMAAEGWIWIDTVGAANLNLWGWISGTYVPWLLAITTSRQLQFRCHIGGVVESVTTTATLSTAKPYWIGFQISGRDVTFWLWDEDAQTLTTEVYANGLSSATRDANIGGNYILQTAGTWVVWASRMRVWNYARTQSEMDAARFRPFASGSVPASCVHYVEIDDGTGTALVDRSATAANGTITGAGTSTWLPAMQGSPDLAGTPQPDVLGERFGCAPVLVSPVHSAYLVAGGGAVQDITTFEGGNPHTMSDAASARAFLVAATPAAGTSLRYKARGWFRIAAPTLPIVATVKGYNGSGLGYVNTAAPMLRYLATQRGPKLADPGDIDTASFTAAGTAAPAIQGVFLPTPRKLREVMDQLCLGGRLWWGFRRGSSQISVNQFVAPSGTPSVALTQRHIVSIKEMPPAAPIYQVVVKYRENDVPLQEDQVAAAIKGTATWGTWTQAWLEAPSRVDEALRAEQGSERLVVETALQYAADAQALADALFDLLTGTTREGWQVVVNASGLNAALASVMSITYTNQAGDIRMGLDGTGRYSILTVEDNQAAAGTATLEGWG